MGPEGGGQGSVRGAEGLLEGSTEEGGPGRAHPHRQNPPQHHSRSHARISLSVTCVAFQGTVRSRARISRGKPRKAILARALVLWRFGCLCSEMGMQGMARREAGRHGNAGPSRHHSPAPLAFLPPQAPRLPNYIYGPCLGRASIFHACLLIALFQSYFRRFVEVSRFEEAPLGGVWFIIQNKRH